MARALIVGCGCRGRALGAQLASAGWQVRGTSRATAGLAAIEAQGLEAAQADPDRVGTVLELVGDVAVVIWALGSARGSDELVKDVHGARLERLLERLVDTPVRGFVYEARGTAPPTVLEEGAAYVREAGERWRIPVRVVRHDPGDHAGWTHAIANAARDALGTG